MEHLNYTEVNKETFNIWSKEFLEQLRAEEEICKTDQDLRDTGKEWFMKNKSDMNIILIEEAKDGEEEDPLDFDD